MAKEKRELSPAERLLAKWAQDAKGESFIPDFDPEFSASFQNLWVLMTWKEVGQLGKLPGVISFQADGSAWRITYRDPTAKRSLAVMGGTLLEGLRKLDMAIVADDAPWTGGNSRNRAWRELKKK